MKKEKYQPLKLSDDTGTSHRQDIVNITREKIERLLGPETNGEWFGIFTTSDGTEVIVNAWSHNYSLDRCGFVSIFCVKPHYLHQFKMFLEL